MDADLKRDPPMAERTRLSDAEHDRLARELTDKGRLIEAGWQSLRHIAIHPDADQIQLETMRQAFFAGAQHLFGSIMGMLDPEQEPTEADMRRMNQIDAELRDFIEDFERRFVKTAGTA